MYVYRWWIPSSLSLFPLRLDVCLTVRPSIYLCTRTLLTTVTVCIPHHIMCLSYLFVHHNYYICIYFFPFFLKKKENFIYYSNLSSFCLFVCFQCFSSQRYSLHYYRFIVVQVKKKKEKKRITIYPNYFFYLPLKTFLFFLWVIAWFFISEAFYFRLVGMLLLLLLLSWLWI